MQVYIYLSFVEFYLVLVELHMFVSILPSLQGLYAELLMIAICKWLSPGLGVMASQLICSPQITCASDTTIGLCEIKARWLYLCTVFA
jgi:hypothetical protein